MNHRTTSLAGKLLLAIAYATLLGACQERSSELATDEGSEMTASNAGLRLPSVLVELSWLREHLDDPNLVLLDARPMEQYLEAHLPGAISLDYEETYSKDEAHKYDLAPIAEVSTVLGSRGLDMSESVVIYGSDDTFKPACRLFWSMEVLGHPSVAVLNGGLKAWTSQGGSLEKEVRTRAPKSFVAEPNADRLATKHEVALAMREGRTRIVDSRPKEHYLGQAGWESQPRWGHIPGAIHLNPVDSKHLEDGNAVFGAPEDLQPIYQELANGEVITYCNAGHEATVSYMLLRSLDAQVSVYDGSWCEWSEDSELPAENEFIKETSAN